MVYWTAEQKSERPLHHRRSMNHRKKYNQNFKKKKKKKKKKKRNTDILRTKVGSVRLVAEKSQHTSEI